MQKEYNMGYVSNDIFKDRFTNLPYKRLTVKEEKRILKVIKLSYYDEVDEETQKKYIDYYGKMFPDWYKEYNEADEESKNILLNQAIEKSLEYRDAFIKNNMRFVIYIARKYYRFDSLENLCQEGMTSLIKAIKYFDFNMGYKFSSFAHKSIVRHLRRYIEDNCNIIRIPNKKIETINRMASFEDNEMKKTGVNPSDEELMEKFNLNKNQLTELKRCREIIRITSLDESVGEEKDTVLGELVEDRKSRFEEKIYNTMMDKELIKKIDEMKLSVTEKEVIYRHYGVKDYEEPCSFSDIAKDFGVTVGRIRQIESRALRKIRNELVREQLKETVEEEQKDEEKKEQLKFKEAKSFSEKIKDPDFRYLRESILCSNLRMLTDNERYVLKKVYGLNHTCLSDELIALNLNLTVEDVNKIEKRALNKLGIKLVKNSKKYHF